WRGPLLLRGASLHVRATDAVHAHHGQRHHPRRRPGLGVRHPARARGRAAMSTLAVRAPLAWLGPGRLVEDALVVMDGGRVVFAGSSKQLAVRFAGGAGSETLSGEPVPPEPDQEIHVDGFVMPGVVDRHVHIGLSDPGAVLTRGVTAVRDLAWPADTIFSLAEASESPSFNGPLIRCAGPMITCTGGYPTRSSWAPKGTGVEVRGPSEAAEAARSLLALGAGVRMIAITCVAWSCTTDMV